MKSKFEYLLFLAPFLAQEYDPARAGEFFDALNHGGPGDSLRAIVDLYEKPVGEMVQDAAQWFFSNGPKPEWLTHAGL